MYIIKRAINGISLNGSEFLLNEDGSVRKYNTRQDAISLLLENGVNPEECSIEEDVILGKYSEDRCPKCNSYFDVIESGLQDDQYYYKCKCLNCDAEFTQWYLLVFQENVITNPDY